jgi:lactate racemase
MDISLKYGNQIIPLSLPVRTVLPEFEEPVFEVDKEVFVRELQANLSTGSYPLQKIAVVVSDKTRLCGYPEYLPWVTETLLKLGAQKKNITFFIAYGTHAKQTEEESLKSYGETYRNFQFVHHQCADSSLFENKGVTSYGTPVDIRKDILQCTLLITFGSISHHYFAGYGGGRKLLFPGLASKKAIYHNHGLFLDRSGRALATECQPGQLEGNPLATDLKEIDSFLPQKISIHGILNASGKVCRLMVGKDYHDFVRACAVHDHYYRYKGKEIYDLVIASSGGYPKDINFIQAHKSVHHAAAFVKDGGHLIILSECIDKVGSDYFLKYLETGSFSAAFDILEQHYEGNGGTALSMMTKTKRIHISMLTSLNDDICQVLGVSRITPEKIQQKIEEEIGSIAVIRNASMLIR